MAERSLSRNWKTLYVAALVEPDKAKIPLLIDDAQYAIVERARELFSDPGEHLGERVALDDAL